MPFLRDISWEEGEVGESIEEEEEKVEEEEEEEE